MAEELTKKQSRVLTFIENFIEREEYPPTVREIAKEFGIKNPTGVTAHLKALKKKGFIDWKKNVARTIRILNHE